MARAKYGALVYRGDHWGQYLGFPQGYADAELPIGVSRFWSPAFYGFTSGF
ncbi:hypothetical protein MKR64_02070 [Acinetobacter baumannii]